MSSWPPNSTEEVPGAAARGATAPDAASPSAGPFPRITLRVTREPGSCRVEVADRDVGIPPEDLERVFDPFFPGANGQLYPEATGMGLYLARAVCTGLGHALAITSERGRGTTAAVVIRTDTTTALRPAVE